MSEIEIIIEKLLNHYNVSTLGELAEQMSLKQSSISSWKSRGSLTPIKKKCRELGIYNDIFGDINIQQIGTINNSQNSNVNNGDMSNSSKDNVIDLSSIPNLVLDDLNNLFKLAIEKDKKELLIDKLDDFIYQSKKEFR